jgi:hypothetical protein
MPVFVFGVRVDIDIWISFGLRYHAGMSINATAGRIPFNRSANEVLSYLMGYFEDNGYMPTRSEIAAHMSRKRDRTYTSEWARWVLAHLERQGRVRIDTRRHRGIVLMVGGTK